MRSTNPPPLQPCVHVHVHCMHSSMECRCARGKRGRRLSGGSARGSNRRQRSAAPPGAWREGHAGVLGSLAARAPSRFRVGASQLRSSRVAAAVGAASLDESSSLSRSGNRFSQRASCRRAGARTARRALFSQLHSREPCHEPCHELCPRHGCGRRRKPNPKGQSRLGASKEKGKGSKGGGALACSRSRTRMQHAAGARTCRRQACI